MSRPVVLAVTSDHHVNSTLGLCPEEGVRLDEGGTFHPSKVQLWQWYCWTNFHDQVRATVKALKARLVYVSAGDMYDGDHHGTTQIVSRNPEVQSYLGDRVFGVIRDLRPEKVYVVRGTETHVGPGGSAEEARARWLRAEKDPERDTWSHWRLRLAIHDDIVDVQHHGRVGTRPWTRGAVLALAHEIFAYHAERGIRPPTLAIRGHRHSYGDSGPASGPTRVIQLPAWQTKTGYAHKVAPEPLETVGGMIFVIRPGVPAEVRPVLYQADPPPLIKV